VRHCRLVNGGAAPVAKVRLDRVEHAHRIDIAGNRQHTALGREVARMKVVQRLARQRAHCLLVAIDGGAIGMLAAKERFAETPRRHAGGVLLAFEDADQLHLAQPFDMFSREGGPAQNVGQQVEQVVEIFRQRGDAEIGAVRVRRHRQRRADILDRGVEGGVIIMGAAARQHAGDKGRQPRLRRCSCTAPARSDPCRTATGDVWFSRTSTVRPLGSVVRRIVSGAGNAPLWLLIVRRPRLA
jgi:hypothetical protein